MKQNLKNKVDAALTKYLNSKIAEYNLTDIDAILGKSIKEFILRDGKRIRPILFLVSYLGFTRNKRLKSDQLKTALAFELLHDFLLIHDDIIDNSNTRRGKPTLHKIFQSAFGQSEKIGKDLSIVAADIIFAIAVDAFLSIKANPIYKQAALKVFLKTTILTGVGEFKDVCSGFTPIGRIKAKQIHLNYKLKTAEYTFKAPLVCGCILGASPAKEIKKFTTYAQLLGQAFQIQDDLRGLFEPPKKIGKSVLSDIIESKKTLPMFLAYNKASASERKFIGACLGNKNLTITHLKKIRQIIINTGADNLTKTKIKNLLNQANRILRASTMHKKYKQLLITYTSNFIKI